MAYKINGTTVVDNSRNVCACCVTSCCITASSRMDAPSGTTAQRPSSPATGSIYFDTDLSSLVSYDGTAWNTVGGAGGIEVDDITTDSTEPWAFMTMNLFEGHECRCYSPNCHGCSSLDLRERMPGTDCNQAECYAGSCYQGSRYNGTNNPGMYVPGPNKFCCTPSFCHHCFLSCTRNIPVPYRGSFTCDFQYTGGCTPWNVNFSGHDGSIDMLHRVDGVLCLRNFCSLCSQGKHLFNTFINKNGGVTGMYDTSVLGSFNSTQACGRHEYTTFTSPRYHGFSKYGAVASIKAPLCLFEGASCGFTCPASFIVKSDTYGTGSEEACCFAFRHNSTWCCGKQYYRIGGYSAIGSFIMQICPALTFYGDGCLFCNLSAGICGANCCCCCFLHASHGLMEFYNKKTDVYGGSNVTDREAYTSTACTYSDGLTIKTMPIGNGCQFGLTHMFGFEACCYCLMDPSRVYDSNTYYRLRFLSRDGCYIHFIKKENLSNNDATTCCCPVDCQHTSCPACFQCYKRMYYARINRVTASYDCFYGECCMCFPPAFCCMGCVKGTHRLCNCVYAGGNDTLFQGREIYTPRQPDQTIAYSGGCLTAVTGDSISSSRVYRGLEETSWNAWSHVCTRKALFVNFACSDPSVTIFDCCKELLERSASLYKLNSGCDWNKFTTMFGVGPCYLCHCGASVPEYCYLMGSTSGAPNSCNLAQCITAVTGCVFTGLSQKCLGYILKRGSHTYSYFGFLPTGNGSDNNTYLNKANDHIVMIRAMKHDSSSCTCGRQFYWIGAICYDIHNDCISKVNTLFPAPKCELQRICCCWNTIVQCNCCDQPLQDRCMTSGSWKACCNWYTCCNSNGGCASNHISAIPYGNQQYYIESGCTDLGGVMLNMSNVPGEIIAAKSCNNSQTFYWYCTALGCNIGNTVCCTYMCVVPGQNRIAKVPYSKPLECVGWRSEPLLACWMNAWFFPEKSPILSFLPITANDACHKCFICCQSSERIRNYGCVKQVPTNNCFVCPVYGSKDCNRGNKEFKIWDSNCCLYFNCCCITAGTNGTWCPVKMCNFFKCSSAARPSCAEIYDNILPCHLDSTETSKRYISKFIQTASEVVSKPYYAEDGSSFEGKWIKSGDEDPNSRFSRLWHEDVIECC